MTVTTQSNGIHDMAILDAKADQRPNEIVLSSRIAQEDPTTDRDDVPGLNIDSRQARLTQEEVAAMLPFLQRFAETGRLV